MTTDKTKAAREAAERVPHTVLEWGGFKAGDVVRLTGERGGRYTIISAEVNADDTVKHVNLVGGKPMHQKLRSVLPERIVPTKRKSK